MRHTNTTHGEGGLVLKVAQDCRHHPASVPWEETQPKLREVLGIKSVPGPKDSIRDAVGMQQANTAPEAPRPMSWGAPPGELAEGKESLVNQPV